MFLNMSFGGHQCSFLSGICPGVKLLYQGMLSLVLRLLRAFTYIVPVIDNISRTPTMCWEHSSQQQSTLPSWQLLSGTISVDYIDPNSQLSKFVFIMPSRVENNNENPHNWHLAPSVCPNSLRRKKSWRAKGLIQNRTNTKVIRECLSDSLRLKNLSFWSNTPGTYKYVALIITNKPMDNYIFKICEWLRKL